jgi:hypothetical protein
MAIFSSQECAFFQDNGYVVLSGAVPPENLAAVVDATWAFLGMDRHNPEDWYREPLRTNGMVELYQHQALWDNRQHPRVDQAFVEILGTPRLWVSIDRVCLKPPARADQPEFDRPGFIHWDIDTSRLPIPLGVQGVLCLEDTAAEQGGFQCVPGMHRRLEAWIQTQPVERNPYRPALAGLDGHAVPGRAGDLILWNQLLPHGNGRNLSARPRLAQYLTMRPAREHDDAEREERVDLWQRRLPPRGKPFPGDPRRIEELNGTTATLSPLGRRLLGIDRW